MPLAVLALASCGGSSGNGIASKTPTEILALSKQAADSAKSVHVAGSIVSKGSPLTLDLFLLAGKGARGRLSEGGSSFELIEAGGTVYLRGSAAFYKRSSMNKYIAPFLCVDHAQLTQFSPVMPRHMNQTPIAHLAAHLGIQRRAINNNIQFVRFFAWENGLNDCFRF